MTFTEAIEALAQRQPTASTFNSAEWAAVDPAIRNRSFFSSLVESLKFLDRGKNIILDGLEGVTEEVTAPDGTTSIALKEGGKAKFIEMMREVAEAEGMAGPEAFREAKKNDITNIGGERRLALIFDTAIQTSFGFGDYEQGVSDPEILAYYPASRFIRVSPVVEPRPRHQMTEGEVRLKNDFEFWADFENDPTIGGFGVPWAPFGYNSGMGTEDVQRREAERLGLLRPGQQVPVPDLSRYGKGKPERYNTGIEVAPPVDPKLKDALREALRQKYGKSVIGPDGRVNLEDQG